MIVLQDARPNQSNMGLTEAYFCQRRTQVQIFTDYIEISTSLVSSCPQNLESFIYKLGAAILVTASNLIKLVCKLLSRQ